MSSQKLAGLDGALGFLHFRSLNPSQHPFVGIKAGETHMTRQARLERIKVLAWLGIPDQVSDYFTCVSELPT